MAAPTEDIFDPFDEEKYPLTPMHHAARANIAEQEALFQKFAEAHEQPVEEIARRIGVDLATVEAALAGKDDLTLTELRMLAVSAEVVISYTVTPVAALPKAASHG